MLQFPASARPQQASAATDVDTSTPLRPWENRQRHVESWRRSAPRAAAREGLIGSLSALLLIAALLLGGGTRNYLFTDLVVQLLASVLLVYGLARLRWRDLDVSHRQLLTLVGAVLALPLLHVVPLPTAIVQWFPGRGELWSQYRALGLEVPAFVSWTVAPNSTLAALRAMLPAAALAVLVSQLSVVWRRWLVLIVVAIALLNVPIGIAQVAQGPHSELRPYVPTNLHDAVGLFANRNHYASLLVVGLVFVFGGMLLNARRARSRSQQILQMLGWMVLGGMLLLGDMLSRSRAGVGLAGLVALAMLLVAFGRRREQPQIFRWFLAFVVLGGLLAIQFGFMAIADRLSQAGDQRWDVTTSVLAVAAKFGWLGSGIGSFPAVYAAYEPIELVGAKILNHAHNDWAELWVELGVLLIPVALLLLRFLWLRARELTGADSLARPEHALRLVGLGVIIVLCIHSLVDYPLRTTAMSAVFALAGVLACSPITTVGRRDDGSSRHRADER